MEKLPFLKSPEERTNEIVNRNKSYFQEVSCSSSRVKALTDMVMLMDAHTEGDDKKAKLINDNILDSKIKDGEYWVASEKIAEVFLLACSYRKWNFPEAINDLKKPLKSLVTELHSEEYKKTSGGTLEFSKSNLNYL